MHAPESVCVRPWLLTRKTVDEWEEEGRPGDGPWVHSCPHAMPCALPPPPVCWKPLPGDPRSRCGFCVSVCRQGFSPSSARPTTTVCMQGEPVFPLGSWCSHRRHSPGGKGRVGPPSRESSGARHEPRGVEGRGESASECGRDYQLFEPAEPTTSLTRPRPGEVRRTPSSPTLTRRKRVTLREDQVSTTKERYEITFDTGDKSPGSVRRWEGTVVVREGRRPGGPPQDPDHEEPQVVGTLHPHFSSPRSKGVTTGAPTTPDLFHWGLVTVWNP